MKQTCSNVLASPARQRAARRILTVAVLSSATLVAGADFSIGVGGGTDRGRVDCVASFPCERSSSHAKLYAGYQLREAVDLQLVYFDGGSFKGGDTTPLGLEFGGTFKVNGVGVAAGYRWNLSSAWSLGARAGLAAVRTRFDHANSVWGSASQTTTQPLLGLGIAYALTPNLRLGLDYDVTRFKVHTTRGPLQMVGLAAQFSF